MHNVFSMQHAKSHASKTCKQEFVARGICPELSLGYNVTMSKSPAGFLRATNKKVVELSIVRQGAREGCKIRGFSGNAIRSASKMTGEMFSGGQAGGKEGSRHHRVIV